MSITVHTKSFDSPVIDYNEILKYSGCAKQNENINTLANECISEIIDQLSYKTCYCILPVEISDDQCDFSIFKIKSSSLSKNLEGCNKAILISATIGSNFDRYILRYSSISPSKALMIQAIGTERIETLCNEFEKWYKQIYTCELKPRFSPGYGDLPLSIQKNIFNLLKCDQKIGLTLNDSLLMSPSKSVTAFIGIKK